MFWLFRAARLLKTLGVLSMNRRNAQFILDHNPRALFPIVDDKLKMQELCGKIGVPTPDIFAAIASFGRLKHLDEVIGERTEFVVKPNCGSGGRGILVVSGREGAGFLRHNGDKMSLDDLRQHLSDILSGMYSLGGHTDVVLLQQRVHLHPAFAPISFKGIPDIRVVLFKNQPALAMLRLPTRASGGRANLHQGGLGVGINLQTGLTHHAVVYGKSIKQHPDTGAPLLGVQVPYWDEILEMSGKVAAAVGLGYVGVDIVVDPRHGPMLLEANARPGLAIQLANAAGLWRKLREIESAGILRPRQDTSEDADVVWRHDAPEEVVHGPHR
jgi:alpha-L-glutamate ligase-like protein